MSIELPLIRALVILPHYRSERNPQTQRCMQIRLQVQNAGSAKSNHEICRSVFPSKIMLKNFWGWLTGSLNLHKQFRFGFQGSVVKTASAAAWYSVSDESSERNGAVKKEMLKLRMKLPEESELGLTDGPEIEDGGGGRGGNGHGDNGKGNNNGGSGDSEGNDYNSLLKSSEWWWWWCQCQRTNKISSIHTHEGCDCSNSVCLADTVAEMVAAETMKSLKLVASSVTDLLRLLALDEIISFVVALPILSLLLLGMPQELAQVGCITLMAAILALLAALSQAVWWFSLWWRNRDQHDHGNVDDSGDL